LENMNNASCTASDPRIFNLARLRP